MNSVPPQTLFPYVKRNKCFLNRTVFKTRPGIRGHHRNTLRNFSLQSDMAFNNFLCQKKLLERKGKGEPWTFSFFYIHLFGVLQNEHCVYCAPGGDLTIFGCLSVLSALTAPTRLSTKHQQQGPRQEQAGWWFHLPVWRLQWKRTSLLPSRTRPVTDSLALWFF